MPKPDISDLPPLTIPTSDALSAPKDLFQRFGCHESEEFWFADGTVILACESTAFRVHRGVLAMHSEVFRDMFAVGQSAPNSPGNETFDGCPVVRLQDEAEDIFNLLRTLYYREYDISVSCVFSTRILMRTHTALHRTRTR